MRKKYWIVGLVGLFCAGPLWVLATGQADFDANWRNADRASAHLAPDPMHYKPAVVQIYAARTFSWRGIFAVHTWIAVKPRYALHYRVYQVIGWRARAGLPVVFNQQDVPDRTWYNHKPWIIKDIRGAKATRIIYSIERVIKKYPYKNEYSYWPGPNSNTFVAYIARHIPSLKLAMPANAIGKDYLGTKTFFARTPSNSGVQLSLYGVYGILLSLREGFELNVLGLVIGINPFAPAIMLPAIGKIGW